MARVIHKGFEIEAHVGQSTVHATITRLSDGHTMVGRKWKPLGQFHEDVIRDAKRQVDSYLSSRQK